MRRFLLCFFLLMPAFCVCWSERGLDVTSSSKGLVSNTCGNNPGAKNPYSNKRYSLPQVTNTSSSGITYIANVDVFAWGDYDCALYVSGNQTSGQDPATEDTILGVTIATSAGPAPSGSYRLVSFRLNNYLPASAGLGFVSCQNNSAGVTPCDNQGEDDYSPVPEPAPIAGVDGSGSLWTFGNIFQLSGVTTGSTPNGPPMQLTTTPPELAAALLVPGCAPDPSANPPQDCIATDTSNHSNGLSPQTTYTITIEDVASGQLIVLGTPPLVQSTSGKGHDVFSASNYNPIPIVTSIFTNQVFDLSLNYPQLDASGVPVMNGFAASAYPPPCANNSGICQADDAFPNAAFHAIWFDFAPAANNPISIDTAHSHFDTILSVFTGAATNLQPVANGINDDNPNATLAQGPRSSAVVFAGVKGVVYHILVSEYPAIDSVNPSPDPGFDIYEAPLSSDPTLNFTLTTPQLTGSPATLPSFGSVIEGTSSQPQPLTLSATYSSASSGISSIAASMSAGAGDFQIASSSGCVSSLADQASCKLNIVFSPSAVGPRTGTLTVGSSAENSPLTFSFSGTGLPAVPVLGLVATPLSFGNQLLQTSSTTSSLVLTNAGTAPLIVSAVSTSGDFSETTNCSSIPAGGQCTVSVVFTPTQTGLRSGQLSITDNATGSPQLIALSGMGTDFALQASSGSSLSVSLAPGASTTYNISVIPISGFTGPVAVSCSGAPPGGSCTPSASTVNIAASAVPVAIAVTTTASSALAPYQPAKGLGWLIPLGTLTLLARRRRFFSVLALLLCAFSLLSCGGGVSTASNNGASQTGSTQPTGVTSTLTLTGVSGTQVRTVALTLTVQ